MCRRITVSLVAFCLFGASLHAEDAPLEKTKARAKAEPKAPSSTKAVVKTEATPPQPAPLNEKTIKERASYAIGINFGRELAQGIRQDGADVDIDLIVKGVKDALTASKSTYSDQELSTAIEAFDKALQAKTIATSKAAADKNKKEGEAFLAKNKQVEGVETTPSGLQYKVIKSGNGKSPQRTDTVRVHYHGTLPDGTAFDSSKLRGAPVEFPVTGVIKGWTEALLSMKVGDQWKLYVPSDLAYGSHRRSDAIGPNQVLVFEVELLDIVPSK